jgi:hypothetical protein
MTQQSIRTAGEHSRKAATLCRDVGVPDRVHATVKAVEAPRGYRARDGAGRISEPRLQLPDRYDAVLPARQLCQGCIPFDRSTRSRFLPHSGQKLDRTRSLPVRSSRLRAGVPV